MRLRLLLFSILAASLATTSPNRAAQTPAATPVEVDFIKTSLKTLDIRDDAGALKMSKDVAALGPKALPVLADVLANDRDCVIQWVASSIVGMIEPANPLVFTTVAEIARGHCTPAAKEHVILMRQAAMELGRSQRGIPVVIELLKSPDVFQRQSGAFALHDLLEVAGAEKRPDRLEATPPLIAVTKDAIVALKAVLGDEDEIVRCVAFEGLQRGSYSANREIADAAKKAVSGAKPKCRK